MILFLFVLGNVTEFYSGTDFVFARHLFNTGLLWEL